jgi:hypothetical protein
MTAPATDGARAAAVFARYDDELLRHVAGRLVRPRQHWPADELIDRMSRALDDPVSIDRTLKPLSPAARQLLHLIGLSRQFRWPVQGLADLLLFLGHVTGLGPVLELLETGLLLPALAPAQTVRSLEVWLGQAGAAPIEVEVLSLAAERCRAEPLALPDVAPEKTNKLAVEESDGLEWLLRLAALWQTARTAGFRQTQSGGLFKRDLDRLRAHPLLATMPPDTAAQPADPAVFVFELGRALGVLADQAEDISAGTVPDTWERGLAAAVGEIWAALFAVAGYDPLAGYGAEPGSRWVRSAGLALVATLAKTAPGAWVDLDAVAGAVAERHPEWRRDVGRAALWCAAYAVGLLQPLKLAETARADDGRRVRLTALARTLLNSAPPPDDGPAGQALLVQPNLEVVLYRQGLTPLLLGQLTRFAEWKTVGLACTLALTAESVYRGLESGLSAADVQRILERHSSRPLPPSVVETLRSWASKRERVQVYPSAVLLEFRTPAELELATKQGLVDQAVTERIGLVASDSTIDYTRFRLVGTRDYLAADEPCVQIGDDGLMLTVHEGRADLLLGSEIRRISPPGEPADNDRTVYRLNRESLKRARELGVDVRWLEEWFRRRTGAAVPATIRLLFLGADAGTATLTRCVVVQVTGADVADGLEHWPAFRALEVERLGPTTFRVPESAVQPLSRLLAELGLRSPQTDG